MLKDLRFKICITSMLICIHHPVFAVENAPEPLAYFEYAIHGDQDQQPKLNIHATTAVGDDLWLKMYPTDRYLSTISHSGGKYLTAQGWYRADHRKYPQGYKTDRIVQYTNNQLTLTPYNLDHFDDLKFSATYQWQDISAKTMDQFLQIDEYNISQTALSEIRQLLEKQRFPKGAMCLKYSNLHASTDYILILPELDTASDEQMNSSYRSLDQYLEHHQDGHQVERGVWATIPWATLMHTEYEGELNPTYVFINNKVYDAIYFKAAKQIEDVSCKKLNKIASASIEKVLKPYL